MKKNGKNKILMHEIRKYDKQYFEAERELSYYRIKNTVSLLGNITGKQILDIGCGTGEGSALLNKLGAKVVCLDVAKYAMSICRKLNFNGVLAVAHALPFREDSFDGVLLMDVIEHVPKDLEKKLLFEVKRITKPHAKIAIHTMPNLFLEKLSMIYGLVNKKHWRRWGVQGGHINTYTPWKLKKTLRSVGLEIHCFKIGIYPNDAPFSSIVTPLSHKLRGILGNDIWVCCRSN
jgi:2-polyprenyl-3-methyl-5-hydroxy-6-metoxy-1,4-benzoquinol methylase